MADDKSVQLLAKLADRRPVLIDLSLERMLKALDRLGNPHRRLPPVFHVAGTNGKGSTIAFLRSIFKAARKSVHVYTSPHLVRFNERIVLAGEEIGEDALVDVITRCDEAVAEQELTYFEAITCAAFLAFSEVPADFLLLEVGLGGRLDATNVIDKPLATLITPVALDHQSYLGTDIPSIAREKAGIMRPECPVAIGPQAPAGMVALEKEALRIGAHQFKYGEDWNVYSEQGRLVYQDDNGLSDLAMPRLPGLHQIFNAGLAIAGLRAARLLLPDAVLSEGLAEAHWPARMQHLRYGPLVDRYCDLTGEPADIWLDGGHNPHAARAIASVIADLDERLPRPVHLIAGFQANKDIRGYFDALSGLVVCIHAVCAYQNSAATPADVVKAAQQAGIKAVEAGTVEAALDQIFSGEADTVPRVLICGSLYLAGEILEQHG